MSAAPTDAQLARWVINRGEDMKARFRTQARSARNIGALQRHVVEALARKEMSVRELDAAIIVAGDEKAVMVLTGLYARGLIEIAEDGERFRPAAKVRAA